MQPGPGGLALARGRVRGCSCVDGMGVGGSGGCVGAGPHGDRGRPAVRRSYRPGGPHRLVLLLRGPRPAVRRGGRRPGPGRRGRGSTCVALVLPSCPEHVVLYAAAAKLGAVTAGVNHRLTPHERDAVLRVADADLVVTTPDAGPRRRRGGPGPDRHPGRRDSRRPGRPPGARRVATPAPRRPRPARRDRLHLRDHRPAQGGRVRGPADPASSARSTPAAAGPTRRSLRPMPWPARRSPTSGPPPSWPATCTGAAPPTWSRRWRAADALRADRGAPHAASWPASPPRSP